MTETDCDLVFVVMPDGVVQDVIEVKCPIKPFTIRKRLIEHAKFLEWNLLETFGTENAAMLKLSWKDGNEIKEISTLDMNTEVSSDAIKDKVLVVQYYQRKATTASTIDHSYDQLEQEIQKLNFRIHRLEHTATIASDVGSKVLGRAGSDSVASFLPSLPPTVNIPAVLSNIPPGVHTKLRQVEDELLAKKQSRKQSDQFVLSTVIDYSDQEVELDHDLSASAASHTVASATVASKKQSARSNTEQVLQNAYNELFPYLINNMKSSLRFHDTSVRNYLTSPTGKIDITLTASGLVAWPDVVTLGELKPSLQPKPVYEEAIGQVIQRCQDIFDIQEQRHTVVAMVMDGKRIDVLQVTRGYPVQVVHTGCIPFELNSDSFGFKLLLRTLASTSHTLGFVPPLLPEPFELTPLETSGRPSRTKHTVKDFIPLRVGSLSLRTSTVYRASCNRWPDEYVVVKFTPADALDSSNDSNHEAVILTSLGISSSDEQCLSVPTLLATGTLPQPIEHLHHYIIIKPYGSLLPLGEDALVSLICPVFIAVCKAMRFAYEHHRILHRDISYGNIIQKDGNGYLIDWHVAYPQQATGFKDRITGTPLFTAHRLQFLEHAHDLRDDLESLLYALMYIAMGARLPWDHAPHKTMDPLKRWYLVEDSPFEQLVTKCTSHLQPFIRQLRNVLNSTSFDCSDEKSVLALLDQYVLVFSPGSQP